MNRAAINPAWPNALRWFLVQDLKSFTPWHLLETPDELAYAAAAFRREDVSRGDVFVFVRRQDRDDFAGLEIVGGAVGEKVILFHPAFLSSEQPSPRTWNVVRETYDDVFEFVARRVTPDMREWALTEDAAEL